MSSHNKRIDVQTIEIQVPALPAPFDGFRIAQVSDVHLKGLSPYADEIVETVRTQRPDIIVLTGDTVHNYVPVKKSGLSVFLTALCATCPVYAITGNHELRSGDSTLWANRFSQEGAVPLDNRCTFLVRGESSIALMGLAGNAAFSEKLFSDALTRCARVPRLLMCHRPEYWEHTLSICNTLQPAITFSGHAHGGQVRLPIIGGLFSPGQGFFPRYTSGVYQKGSCSLVVSRGLINDGNPPRINNRPHLPLVILSSYK